MVAVSNMMKWRASRGRVRVEALIIVRSLKGMPPPSEEEEEEEDEGGWGSRLAVEVRWKGSSKTRKEMKNYTRAVCQEDGDDHQLRWDEDFRALCTFSSASSSSSSKSFRPWEVAFFVLNGSGETSKTRVIFAGPAILNLAEYGSFPVHDGKPIEIDLPIKLAAADAKCSPTLCLSLCLTQQTTAPVAPEAVPRPLIPVSLTPCFRGPRTLENDEPYALKASLKRIKKLTDVISSRKARIPSPGEVCSDGKCSTGTGSEDSGYTYPFDSDSFDGTDEDDSEDIKTNGHVCQTVGYGTLVSANLASGAFGKQICGEDEGQLYYSTPKLEVCCEDNAQESALASSEQSLIQSPKRRILSWRKKKGYRSPKNKGEPLLKKEYSEEGGDDIDFDRRQLSSPGMLFLRTIRSQEEGDTRVSEFGDDNFAVGSWEWKEVVSRDGSMKLRAQVFFASIDQRHEKAAGESACTALVTVISNHLLEHGGEIPIKSEFDRLIREGSLQWRNLCRNEAYRERFPDKHFDLETVLQAKVRPLCVEPEKSFVGFFHLEGIEEEGFGFLHGAMSFDGIWEAICQTASDCPDGGDPLVFIVSWNDHFFVLMFDSEAIYIIDTLGERLFEGCKQAYVLKFDKDSVITRTPPEDEEAAVACKSQPEKDKLGANEGNPPQESGAGETCSDETICDGDKQTVICKGKESSKEYINSFLAAIPIRELQADIKRGLMASTPLHHRLQIEFHHMQFWSPAAAESATPEAGKAAMEPAPSL
ncbi:hypothetical protein Droror1_Dr00002150 [Drosera rotundifolia]